jgi:hypothetical protein
MTMALDTVSSPSRLVKLGIGTADPVDTFLRFAEFDPGVRQELYTAEGIAGVFWRDPNQNRENRKIIQPRGRFEPTAAELNILLAWAIAVGTGTTTKIYTPDGTTGDLPVRNVHHFPSAGDPTFLSSVVVDTFTIGANSGEAVAVNATFVGVDFDVTHTSFPSISPDITTAPFMLSDLSVTGGSFTFGGIARRPAGLSITVNNGVDKGRFLNSQTLTRLQKLDQSVTVALRFASGSNSALWYTGTVTPVGIVATFKNINTGSTFVITLPSVKFPAQSPVHAPNQEGMFDIAGETFRAGGTGAPVTFSVTV